MKRENRRKFFKKVLVAGVSSFITLDSLKLMALEREDPPFPDEWMDEHPLIPAPDEPSKWPEWRNALSRWKKNRRVSLNYDGSSYRSASFQWVTTDFACCFIMMCDTGFYDYRTHEYKINQYVEEGKRQFGGYDSVVLWHAYPRIGLDDRNQFDFYRQMPGGLQGLKNVAGELHRSNIRVFIDYNPWDTGTRREPKSDIEVLIDIISEMDADGIFLDTMKDAPDFREKLDAVKPGIVLEGEIALPVEHIRTHHMSWAQGFADSKAPGLYRNKWFEPLHMQHAINRWSADKTAQLHTAWMNGSGMLIWENVFGQWLGWSERDKSIYRTMQSIQHQFSDLFSGEGWTPLSAESPKPGVYISSWKKEGIQLWTLVNRNEYPVEGELMQVPTETNLRYYDLVTGEEVPKTIGNRGISLSGKMITRGIACFISLADLKINNGFRNFLDRQKQLFQLTSCDIKIPVLYNQLIRTKEYVKREPVPAGMVTIPAASLTLNMEYTFREPGGFGNIQEFLRLAETHNLHSPCLITKKAELGKFALDETPVTNLQFREFMESSGYVPLFRENFLKHWINGQIPWGKEDHPVVYVDLEDARAYAKWAGKRLPAEEEWQFAAQGPDSLTYPWGNEMEGNKCNQSTNYNLTAVRAFPEGISPFGCYDMCGNTWELTDSEYSDGRTRFIMLKGGSCYKAHGSVWYTDGGPQKNNFVAKMLLMWPGLDRCSTIGFRCAADLQV